MTSEELKKKVEDLKEKIAKKSDNDHEKKMLKFRVNHFSYGIGGIPGNFR